MATKTPRNTVKVRGLPKVGTELNLKVTVIRTDPRDKAPGDTITIRIPGHSIPVTIGATYLLKTTRSSQAA